MTESDPGTGGHETGSETGVVRKQSFEATDPLDIDVSVGAGSVEIRLVDEPGAHVEVRHDPSAGAPWAQGISNLVNWFTNQFGAGFSPPGFAGQGFAGQKFAGQGAAGDPSGQLGDTVAEAIRQTRIDLTGNRLAVRTPDAPALRHVPVAVTVVAPNGSHLDVHGGSANVTVTGDANRVAIHGGSGDVSVDRADGVASIQTGSGAMRLGPMLGGLRARSGSGGVDVSSIGGSTSLITGTGDVWLGAVQSDIMARTGSGDLTIADAACGEIELFTGSGQIRIGVRSGTTAQVDLNSGSGQARSELDVSDTPPIEDATLRIRGKTGSGNALVTPAVG